MEAPLLIAATFGVCFGSFEIVRRVAWLRPLFGLPMNAKRSQGDTAVVIPAVVAR